MGLALSRGRQLTHNTAQEAAMRECVRPALAASKPAGFLREISRRLPLFAALHAKLLDDVDVRERHAADPASVSQGYADLEVELVSWGDELDDVTQAELDVAIATLRRSNETLLQAASETRTSETADLFRAAVLVEFLLFCLWSLAKAGEHPRIAGQVVYSLRYAALDHAAAVRNSTRCPTHLDSSVPAAESDRAEPDDAEDSDDAEDFFWAFAGALPLVEMGSDT